MVTCEICGRQFKNTQGLRGHKTFVHGDGSPSSASATRADTEPQPSKLEDRLEKLEYVTGLRESSILDNTLNIEKPLTEKLTEVTHQLNSLTQQLASLSSNTASNTEYREIKKQLAQLAQQLNDYNQGLSPTLAVANTVNQLEDELSNRAKNVRVNTLENRIAQLEEEQKETAGNVDKCIRDNKAVGDIQIKKVMEVIDHVVDKFATSVKQIQSQIREQKQVTDWVKKEYNLRPVKKVS